MKPDLHAQPHLQATLPQRAPWRAWYLRGLTWAFMLLTAARLVAYTPTVASIVQSRSMNLCNRCSRKRLFIKT